MSSDRVRSGFPLCPAQHVDLHAGPSLLVVSGMCLTHKHRSVGIALKYGGGPFCEEDLGMLSCRCT